MVITAGRFLLVDRRMNQRVLVATDLSEGSNEAIRQARAFAASSGSKMAVCHVLPDLFGIRSLFAPRNETSAGQVTEVEARVHALVENQLAALSIAPGVEIFLDHGSAYAEVVRRAEAWSADLLVVGSTGMSGPMRGHLGTVAENVVRSAHCGVLVARPCSARGVVIAATDFSDPSMPAIAAGIEESRRRNARFVLVHALDLASLAATVEEAFLNATSPARSNIDERLRDAVVVKLESAMARCKASGDVRVLLGSPATAVVACGDELGAELIVVGTRGRTGLARVALGSVAERVIRMAGCSVLAVRLVT